MRMADVEKRGRVDAMNALIKGNKIKLIMSNSRISYELIVPEQSAEDVVLEVIREAGQNGIWVRDIRSKSKLSLIVMNKAIKTLENKKQIKTIKAINGRKLYVLFELQPDESVTGGACYDSGTIKEDIVKNLKAACLQYLYDLYKNSFEETIKTINSSEGAARVDLSKVYANAAKVFEMCSHQPNIFKDIKLEDVQAILDILCFEFKLQKKTMGSRVAYRYNPYNRDKTELFYAPCMVCHVYKDCRPGAIHISPENCRYLSVEKF